MRTAALIPAFEAAETLADVIRGVRDHLQDVVVIDDGSSDETAEIAGRSGAQLLRHRVNRGKGAAILTGLRHLSARGFTHALTLDADGQHLASEVPTLIAESSADPSALVVGQRRIESDVPGIRRFGNEFANVWVWIASGKRLPDTQSGFRIYPVASVLALGLTGARFEMETEVVIRAVRAGIPVRSVPVRVYYPPPEARVSHYQGFRDTVRIIDMVVGLILRLR